MRHVPCIGKVQGDMRPCLLLCMSHLLVMYNRNHSCLVSSHFGVLVERLVSVVVKCVVKDQQVGPFCSSFVYVAIIFFFQFGRTNKKSSLVNTLPKTKKDKHTAVTEAHIECT